MEGNASIQRLAKVVDELIKTHQATQQSNKHLLEKNKYLEEELAKSEEREKELKNKMSALQVAKNLDLDESDKQQLKAQISELVKEIDKCIALIKA